MRAPVAGLAGHGSGPAQEAAGPGCIFPARALRIVLVTCALAAGLAIRVWVLSSHLGEVDQDEAVTGLMARHVLDGEFSVFFWGQAYGGSQEAVVTAALFALFGSGALTLKLVPLALYGLATWLVWRVGRRSVGEPAATLGALLFWLGPTFFVLRSTRAYGFYGTAMVVSLAFVLVVLRLRERNSRMGAVTLGLLLGVGWWTTPQIVFVAVPATIWLVVRAPGMLRQAPLMAAAAVMGASPWLIWNITHHWMSLDTEIFAGVGDNSYADHLRGFFNPLLPMALGLRVPYSRAWILERPLALGIYGALLAAFAFAAVRRWRRAEPLLVVALAYPFLYSLSPAAFYLLEPRYLFLLSPVIALLLALALGGPRRPRSGVTGASAQVMGVAAVAVLCVTGLRQINVPNPVTAPSSLAPLLAALDGHGVDRLYTPYVIAHRISFDSDERIAASPSEYIRHPPLELTVRARPTPAYLFVRGSPLQIQFEAGLGRLEVAAEKTAVGTFDLYLPSARVLPEDWWNEARGLPFIEKAAGVPGRRR
ncbi:MAG: glycosyltransferase family 39 protein [Actinomycetota bacterium]|nr:glycosyltransferase family 39 protein [Actinomycetota bacterium]